MRKVLTEDYFIGGRLVRKGTVIDVPDPPAHVQPREPAKAETKEPVAEIKEDDPKADDTKPAQRATQSKGKAVKSAPVQTEAKGD